MALTPVKMETGERQTSKGEVQQYLQQGHSGGAV